MDPALTELATTGAQTMVSLMVTDAWAGAKKIVARVFRSDDEATAEEVADELEVSRDRLCSSAQSVMAEAQRIETQHWQESLLSRLEEQPQLAALVVKLLDYAASHDASPHDGKARISMHADAADNARVYQQGQGIQHNS